MGLKGAFALVSVDRAAFYRCRLRVRTVTIPMKKKCG